MTKEDLTLATIKNNFTSRVNKLQYDLIFGISYKRLFPLKKYLWKLGISIL